MYAVIKAGGKQHKVKSGDVLEIELTHDAEGEEITFTPILVVDDDGATHFGKDLGRAVVKARVMGEQKGEKVKIFKYRPKTGYSRRQGHRQMFTLVEITDVSMGKRAAPKKEPVISASDVSDEAAAPVAAEPGVDVEGATEDG
jgi:large subunit ribosomal protein L21